MSVTLQARVCRARDMLSGGDATLAEVAVRSGFANQAHMSTAFAREVGLSLPATGQRSEPASTQAILSRRSNGTRMVPNS